MFPLTTSKQYLSRLSDQEAILRYSYRTVPKETLNGFGLELAKSLMNDV